METERNEITPGLRAIPSGGKGVIAFEVREDTRTVRVPFHNVGWSGLDGYDREAQAAYDFHSHVRVSRAPSAAGPLTILAAILLMLVVDWLPEAGPDRARPADLIALTPARQGVPGDSRLRDHLVGDRGGCRSRSTALFVLLLVPVFRHSRLLDGGFRAGFGKHAGHLLHRGAVSCRPGFTRSGLGTRPGAAHAARGRGPAPTGCCSGFLVIGAMLSMWITDMAVAAVLLPLGVGILKGRQGWSRSGAATAGRS